MKHFLLVVMLIGAMQISHAQGGESGKAEQKEEVRGFFEVIGYFSSKLGNELGSRLNLDDGKEEKKEEEMVPTEVHVKIGPFTITRNEMRPAKGVKKKT